MELFNVGETVVRRGSLSGRRGTIVGVTEGGVFVTVRWLRWIGQEGYESTHGPSDLVLVAD